MVVAACWTLTAGDVSISTVAWEPVSNTSIVSGLSRYCQYLSRLGQTQTAECCSATMSASGVLTHNTHNKDLLFSTRLLDDLEVSIPAGFRVRPLARDDNDRGFLEVRAQYLLSIYHLSTFDKYLYSYCLSSLNETPPWSSLLSQTIYLYQALKNGREMELYEAGILN